MTGWNRLRMYVVRNATKVPTANDPMKISKKEAQDMTRLVTGEPPVAFMAWTMVWYITMVTASLNMLSPKICLGLCLSLFEKNCTMLNKVLSAWISLKTAITETGSVAEISDPYAAAS